MSIQSMIEGAVSPVIPEIARGEYTGEGDVYCVWDATKSPDAFGNNFAQVSRYMVQLHLVTPYEVDPQPWIDKVERALRSEDLFSAPIITPVEASEQEGYRQFAFEFDAISREGS